MSHYITLAKAVEMTTLYRQEKENILATQYQGQNILSLCETFDAAPFVQMLSNPLCKSMRVYFGMSEDLKVHTIFVGVNENNEDMLPASVTSNSTTSENSNSIGDPIEDNPILEDGISCPPICPPPSDLNT